MQGDNKLRKQFVKTLKDILNDDLDSVLLLGDIGVYGFRDELKNIPFRTYNIGILEQTTISMAAGLSIEGLTPFVHTIAPFIVERALEQIKIDFGYQNLNGNFVTIGNSYDYASLGCTHHCPGDVQVLMSIPNVNIYLPGTSSELDYLIKTNYKTGLNYYRMGEHENKKSFNIKGGVVVKEGKDATIVCFGNMLSQVENACSELDVTILYYNTIMPFDAKTLKDNSNQTMIICEPFYEGTVNYLITKNLDDNIKLYNIGITREFLINYGTKEEYDKHLSLDEVGIKKQINYILENKNVNI